MLDISCSYTHRRFQSAGYQNSAAEFVLNLYFPDGPKCVSCGNPITGKRSLASFWRGNRTWCVHCEKRFSPRAGTPLVNMHLTFAQFDFICMALDIGGDIKKISQVVGVCTDTVKSCAAKLAFRESHV